MKILEMVFPGPLAAMQPEQKNHFFFFEATMA